MLLLLLVSFDIKSLRQTGHSLLCLTSPSHRQNQPSPSTEQNLQQKPSIRVACSFQETLPLQLLCRKVWRELAREQEWKVHSFKEMVCYRTSPLLCLDVNRIVCPWLSSDLHTVPVFPYRALYWGISTYKRLFSYLTSVSRMKHRKIIITKSTLGAVLLLLEVQLSVQYSLSVWGKNLWSFSIYHMNRRT